MLPNSQGDSLITYYEMSQLARWSNSSRRKNRVKLKIISSLDGGRLPEAGGAGAVAGEAAWEPGVRSQ
jgi:hypothetical protein